MPLRALLVHGFNVRDHGAGTVGRLRPVLTRCGYVARTFPYGWVHLPGVVFWNDNAASLLAAQIKDDEIDLVCAHSNGCALTHQATHLLDDDPDFQRKVRVIYIAPALYRAAPIAACVARAYVLYSRKDWACRLAMLMRPFGWGSGGTYGMTAPGYVQDERHVRHSDWMRDDHTLYDITEPLIAAELHTDAQPAERSVKVR